MLKILFSPSEGKNYNPNNECKYNIRINTKIDYRADIYSSYKNFINSNNRTKIKKLFGIKSDNELNNIIELNSSEKLTKAVELYSGVAYDALNYKELSIEAKKYIDKNLIIFSNLFGPINADANLPYYKLKQGENIDNFKNEKFYKEHYTEALENYIGNSTIVDLRASFYEKFYKINKNHYSFMFIKDGKMVTHYSKKYRGVILKNISNHNLDDINHITKIKINGLQYDKNIIEGIKTTFIYNITK